ncbi:hypothetical protein RFI_23653 [Reticulomyxa filosa]|uniref:Uncharacterized protein n=1 Tax=Reticulomyxa filosa TaxID=46433 RepID=X6MJ70_RETFI|nr:hypothetical protein RFI_23653 [Reticulomyxa filosa]|eukprot:ETO13716.1 hypothetical protein RFI_23653 [Reticulomyxa filosa]
MSTKAVKKSSVAMDQKVIFVYGFVFGAVQIGTRIIFEIKWTNSGNQRKNVKKDSHEANRVVSSNESTENNNQNKMNINYSATITIHTRDCSKQTNNYDNGTEHFGKSMSVSLSFFNYFEFFDTDVLLNLY